MSGWNEGGRSDKEEDERVINFFIFFILFFYYFFIGQLPEGADQLLQIRWRSSQGLSSSWWCWWGPRTLLYHVSLWYLGAQTETQ